jgi:hypothetical protein
VPLQQLKGTLAKLRFSNQETAWMLDLVGHWQAVGAELEAALSGPAAITGGQVRRWASRTGRVQLAPLMRIAAAVWSARRDAGLPAPDASRVRAVHHMLIRSAYRDPIAMTDLAVDGGDLIEAGIPAGALLGKILRMLLEMVIDDPALNQRDRLIAKALEIYRRTTESGGEL